MRKFITMLLVLAMVFGLCACAGSGEGAQGGENGGEGAAATGLQVGFGKVNITPDFSVGLGGYSDAETRRSEGFIDYIYITCIAATSGEETILIYTLDNCAASASVAEKIRGVVSPATGIQNEKIFVGATHSHSCPSLGTSDPEGAKYYQLMLDAAVEAGKTALEDRASASMLVAKPEFEKMNFIRHYKMSDGSFAGSNFGNWGLEPVGYARETDGQMILLKFDRPDDKKDILMVNWQAHPDHGTENGRTNISADFPGAMREKLSADTGMLVAYFTGASGDQNPMSRIATDHHKLGMKPYGEKLAELALSKLGDLQPVEGDTIKTNRVMFDVEVDHSWDHLLSEAREVYDLWKTAGKSAGDALGKQYGFTSSYQARAIISRSGMAKTQTLELNSFCIGDIGFITGTMEMFSTTGKYAKSNSPFGTTFIITGCSGYIPCAEAYDYRSYEADTAIYAKGTAEALAEQYVKMLNDIK